MRGSGEDAAALHQGGVLYLLVGVAAQSLEIVQAHHMGDGRQTHGAIRVLACHLRQDGGGLGRIGLVGSARVLQVGNGFQAYGGVIVLPLLAL